jgi:hypothetical protein
MEMFPSNRMPRAYLPGDLLIVGKFNQDAPASWCFGQAAYGSIVSVRRTCALKGRLIQWEEDILDSTSCPRLNLATLQ